MTDLSTLTDDELATHRRRAAGRAAQRQQRQKAERYANEQAAAAEAAEEAEAAAAEAEHQRRQALKADRLRRAEEGPRAHDRKPMTPGHEIPVRAVIAPGKVNVLAGTSATGHAVQGLVRLWIGSAHRNDAYQGVRTPVMIAAPFEHSKPALELVVQQHPDLAGLLRSERAWLDLPVGRPAWQWWVAGVGDPDLKAWFRPAMEAEGSTTFIALMPHDIGPPWKLLTAPRRTKRPEPIRPTVLILTRAESPTWTQPDHRQIVVWPEHPDNALEPNPVDQLARERMWSVDVTDGKTRERHVLTWDLAHHRLWEVAP